MLLSYLLALSLFHVAWALPTSEFLAQDDDVSDPFHGVVGGYNVLPAMYDDEGNPSNDLYYENAHYGRYVFWMDRSMSKNFEYYDDELQGYLDKIVKSSIYRQIVAEEIVDEDNESNRVKRMVQIYHLMPPPRTVSAAKETSKALWARISSFEPSSTPNSGEQDKPKSKFRAFLTSTKEALIWTIEHTPQVLKSIGTLMESKKNVVPARFADGQLTPV